MDSERRPVDYSYVITQGTFLISNWGNNLIADTFKGEQQHGHEIRHHEP